MPKKKRMCLYMAYFKVHEKLTPLTQKCQTQSYQTLWPYWKCDKSKIENFSEAFQILSDTHLRQISVLEYKQRQGQLSVLSSLWECLWQKLFSNIKYRKKFQTSFVEYKQRQGQLAIFQLLFKRVYLTKPLSNLLGCFVWVCHISRWLGWFS